MVSDLQFAQLDERVTRLEYWRTLKDEHLEYLIKEHNDLLQLLLKKVDQFEEIQQQLLRRQEQLENGQRRLESRLDRQQEQLDRQQEQIEKMVTKDDFNSFKADVMTALQQLLNRQH